MFFCKSKKDSLWRQVIQRKLDFKQKCLNHSITLLQQSSNKSDAQLFLYLGYKKSIEKFQIYQKKKAFHLNNANYLKPYIRSNMYRRLIPAKFVYVLVRMRYFLAVRYKHKLRGESFLAWQKTAYNAWHLLCSRMSK